MAMITRRAFAKAGFAAAASVLAAGAVAGCAGGGESQKADTSGKTDLTIALSVDCEPEAGFDPVMAWGSGEHMHEPLIQSTLINTDKDLAFHNDLATDYSMSDDGLEWTFTIRKDAKFTDGKPLTAKDVAFTINKIATEPKSEAELANVGVVDKATAKDDETCIIKLKRPYNALLYLLAVVGIVPEHAYGADYGTKPIGSGRYLLEQWDRGQQAIFAANPDYYGEKPQIERVVVLFMDEDAALAAANSGEVDVVFTSATLAASAPKGYQLLQCKSVDSRGIALPVAKAGGKKEVDGETYKVGNDVTANLEIRQAINAGVDRQRFVDNVLNGYGTVAYSVGTDMPWYSADMEVEYDAAAAEKFLTDAGWAKADDGVYAKDGTRASFAVYYNASDSVRQAIALEFANQMKEIGIEIEAKGMSWDDLYPHEYSDPIVWGFGSNAPIEVYSLYNSKGGFNVAGYENETVDKYMDDALATPNVDDSFDLWKKAQWDGKTGIAPKGDAPWVWIANIDHLFFTREGLTVAEQKPHPHGHGWSVLNNVDQWHW